MTGDIRLTTYFYLDERQCPIVSLRLANWSLKSSMGLLEKMRILYSRMLQTRWISMRNAMLLANK
jgi:hypothetical protein